MLIIVDLATTETEDFGQARAFYKTSRVDHPRLLICRLGM